MAKTILALSSLLAPEMEKLESHFSVIRLWKEGDPDAAIRKYSDKIQAVLSTTNTPVSRRLIEALPNLEIIAQNAVGIDNIDMEAAQEKDITVVNTPDVLTDDTADIALALLLAVARRICEADMFVRVGKWQNGPLPLGTSLAGKKVGIVGLGRIGRAIATRCEAFRMDVSYYGRAQKADISYRYYNDLAAMAADCDALILACAATPETENLVDYRIMQALGDRGIIINIARGAIVNQGDLLAALSNRIIAGAGLDVYINEPHVPESLFSMDNVVLLPHIGSATTETRTKMGQILVENLLAHFAGKPLLTPVK